MGALADRCPECGVYIKKGALSCRRCGWESEWRPSEPSRAVTRSESERDWDTRQLRAFLRGAAMGALVVVLLMWVGALALQPPEADAPVEVQETSTADEETSREDLAAVAAPNPGLDPATRAEIEGLIQGIKAELAGWRERYRVGLTDLKRVFELLDEIGAQLKDLSDQK